MQELSQTILRNSKYCVYNWNCNLFSYACKTNVDIAFLLLESDHVLPSTINDIQYTSTHPFEYLYLNNDLSLTTQQRVENFERALSSNKFLGGCTNEKISQVFKSFMANAGQAGLISVSLKQEQLTREMIESWSFNTYTIIEWYCHSLTANAKTLQILLDSEKITKEYAEKCCSDINIRLCDKQIQHVLNTHEKLPFVHAHRRVKAEEARESEMKQIEMELSRVEMEIENNELKLQVVRLELEISNVKQQISMRELELFKSNNSK